MRACPTEAIRVREGKARAINELCIDCGACLTECASGAIRPTSRTLDDFDDFAFKVAVPSPVLFGQFPQEVRPEHIVHGLLAVGFDAVWDFGVDLRLSTLAIADYVDGWTGPRPVISITCPVVVRLLQVSYPKLLEQLIRMKPPREIAGREVKRHYSRELGLPEDRSPRSTSRPARPRPSPSTSPPRAGAARSTARSAYRGSTTRCSPPRATRRSTARRAPRSGPRALGLHGELVDAASARRPAQPAPLHVRHGPAQRDPGPRRRGAGQAQAHRLPRVQRVLGRLRQRQPHGRQRVSVAGEAAESRAGTFPIPIHRPRPKSRGATPTRTSHSRASPSPGPPSWSATCASACGA